MVEHLCSFHELLFACNLVQSCKRLVHSAVLTCDVHCPHFLTLCFICTVAQSSVDPGSDSLCNLKSFLVAAVLIAVNHTCCNLVQCVIRSPDCVVRCILLKQCELIRRICAQESLAPCGRICAPQILCRICRCTLCLEVFRIALGHLLQFVQFRNHVIHLLLVCALSCGRICLCQSGEEVSGRVSS